ncbi:MAG: hypothetical protein JSU70_01535 [Phycisphaerales bacterium]|nr:MAG: hypothetical protein JSU70_01535 [Phycisphaerales bacterium]
MNGVNKVRRVSSFSWIWIAAILVLAVSVSQNVDGATLTAGTTFPNPKTGQKMLVFGYDDGTLEFRDLGGNLLQVRYGFDEITVLAWGYTVGTYFERLYVGSTDSGGSLRVINPADIHDDLAVRSGFGRITAMSPGIGTLWQWGDDRIPLYVGSTDLGGTLRVLDSTTLVDGATRSGFGEITAIVNWHEELVMVGSTDSGGAMRCLNPNTLADTCPPRSGFGVIHAIAVGDEDWDGDKEVVVASSDGGGTVRLIELPDMATDLAARSGFDEVYNVAYGCAGLEPCLGGGPVGVWKGTFDSVSGYGGVLSSFRHNADGNTEGSWSMDIGIDSNDATGTYTYSGGLFEATYTGTASDGDQTAAYTLHLYNAGVTDYVAGGDYEIIFDPLPPGWDNDSGVWEVSRVRKAHIAVASSDSGGAVRLMEVDAETLATTLADSAVRFGFGTVGFMGLERPCISWVSDEAGLVTVLSCDGGAGAAAAHLMDENLIDLSSFAVPTGLCLPSCHPDYSEWLAVGMPDCWCYPRQCHGDADGLRAGIEKAGYYYVGPCDLETLLAAWLVKEPPHGPGIASVPSGICADAAHNQSGSPKTGVYRVGPSDLNVFISNWLVREPPHGPGIEADCLDCP